MVYKNGEIARQDQHLIAKATLDDLADRLNQGKYVDLVWAEDALQTMGFMEKGKVSHKFTGPIMMYSRKTAAGIEVLVDRDLARVDDKTPTLHQLPLGQEVGEWYDSFAERLRSYERKQAIAGSVGSVLGCIGGITLASYTPLNIPTIVVVAALVAGTVAGGVLGGYAGTRSIKNPLQPLAKGEDALRYIASTPYVPLQRFEKLKRLDTDHKAEVEALETDKERERVRKR